MEKKKVKWNGMDLFIIIAALAVILAGVYLLTGRGNAGVTGASKNVEVTTIVEIAGKDKEFADIIANGDIVGVGEKEKMMTEVKSIEVLPAKATGYDILEGKVLRSEVPGQYDIRVTLVGEGTETESAIEMNGTAIRVGQNAVLSSKNWAGSGYVIGLETAEK
ncbi:MAG: DUF4330 domain-containing protein [Clostridia bacterium]|nr:DUF4330 domain-containing protein [Clostridia bacterium]